jgi:hypothetical protein
VTWTEQTAAAEWSGRSLHGCVSLADGSIVVAGGEINSSGAMSNEVWHSLDKGITWHQHTTGTPWWSARIGFAGCGL